MTAKQYDDAMENKKERRVRGACGEVDLTKIRTGDLIAFRSLTRDGIKKAWRVVTGYWFGVGFTVTQYHGWRDYVVMAHEIIDHEKGGQQ